MSNRDGFVRATRRRPCPVCRRGDWCGFTADGAKAVCMRVESDWPTKNGGYLHVLSEERRYDPKPLPIVHSHPPAPPEHLDAIYSTLIRGHLKLAAEHVERLAARGLSESDIESNGYRSVPTDDFAHYVCRALSKYDLRGVPGFYKPGRAWAMWNPGKGFFIPVRDSRHRIRALQVRRDDGPTRYLWFSSASKPEGQSSGAPVHFAHPERICEQGRCFVTEGALKADVIAALTGEGCIGFGGLHFPDGFGRGLRKAFPGITELLIAFDADLRTNEAVNRAAFRLISELRLAGLKASPVTWPEQYKGLDDYLAA